MPATKPRRAVPLTVLALLLAASVGCRPMPQIAAANRQLVASLRTAVSARNKQWLEINAQLVNERHKQQTLSDAEFEVLQAIISQARGGDWQGAEKRLIKLSKAQRVTDEDRQRLKQPQPATPDTSAK